MFNYKVPNLEDNDIKVNIEKAKKSKRLRHPLILHKKGDKFNQVFNFILKNSYMKPHLHPGTVRTEKMHLIKGSFELLIFDDNGEIIERDLIASDKKDYVEVPPFTWHTYVMKSETTIIYETMMGIYHPNTWKKLAPWAPDEDSLEANSYLNKLRNKNE